MIASAIPEIARRMLGLPPEGSTFAPGVDALHLFIISTTLAASTAIGVIALYFILHYRQRSPTQFTQPIVAKWPVEAAFITGTLGLFILWWVIGYRQYVEIETPPSDGILVYVQAKQWMWKFTYPNGRSTNDVLVVPRGTDVRLLMTSRDVIHSFYVPGFRIKQDVVPGRYVTAWFRSDRPDSYPVYCAEYCGVSHSRMRGSVVVLDGVAYDAWLAGEDVGAAGPTLAETGRLAATRHACVACHTFDGQRHVGPTWSRLYGSVVELADGRKVVANEAYLTRSMMEPDADVVAGFQAVMPKGYRYSLSAPDAAAIVDFIRSLENGPVAHEVSLPRLAIVEIAADGGLSTGPQSVVDGSPGEAEVYR